MLAYFLRRLALVIPTFLGITILIFAITRVVPGGPVERMLSQMNSQSDQKTSHKIAGGNSALSESSNGRAQCLLWFR